MIPVWLKDFERLRMNVTRADSRADEHGTLLNNPATDDKRM